MGSIFLQRIFMKKLLITLILFAGSLLNGNQTLSFKEDSSHGCGIITLFTQEHTKPLGYCSFIHREQSITINHLKVLNSQDRGQGYGSQLLKQVLTKGLISNIPVYLNASPFQEDLKQYGSVETALNKIIKFYKKHGAEINKQDENNADIVFHPMII